MWDNSVAAGLDCKGLDHCRGIVWDPGIVSERCLHVCYDGLCLIALFRDAMILVHDWAALSTRSGTEIGYCRTITWELGCLGSINPPCGFPGWESVIVPSDGMPDLSREGPFDVHQDTLESWATPQVLDSLPGCQYRMTSYDDDAD